MQDEALIRKAGEIHSASWKESHKAFCSPDFILLHSPERQTEYIRSELKAGKRLFIGYAGGEAVGIVTLYGSMIENLYILPSFQGRGCGTELLHYAVSMCKDTPTLWVLSNNLRAQKLYAREGFALTGKRNAITEALDEIEMAMERKKKRMPDGKRLARAGASKQLISRGGICLCFFYKMYDRTNKH